jgi:hypothetical protein
MPPNRFRLWQRWHSAGSAAPPRKPGKALPATLGGMVLLGLGLGLGWGWLDQARWQPAQSLTKPATATATTQFLVAAGGGAPHYNEIALEKNVLYFQRTLAALGVEPAQAKVYFANGSDGAATIRYWDSQKQDRFKVPEIPHLTGAATRSNLRRAFQQSGHQPDCATFFYFTGHGAYNDGNPENNALILWQETLVSVRAFTGWLDKLPPTQPVVAMMAQCYSGAFANLIYEGGDPAHPVALQTRCGFFATVPERPSVGCTPAVNEADYRDYSSSFFAGLSGVDRTGEPVASADYDQDGGVSYAEAHAFAKVDGETTDWPISTVEAWLQRQVMSADRDRILATPMTEWFAIATPPRRYVIESLAEKLQLSLDQSYTTQTRPVEANTVQEAYWQRLQMELLNVALQAQITEAGSPETQAILQKLLTCENGHWQR